VTRTIVGALAVALALLGGCGGSSKTKASGTVRVFAASSLTEAFKEMAKRFEAENDGVHVDLEFGASSALAQQIAAGADADVLVTADATTIQPVLAAHDRARDPHVIATNRLAVAVQKGNPLGLHALADVARPDVTLVLCAPQVPCGHYAALALQKANVVVKPKSLEENVKGVVGKVELGEADAGIVYATDIRAAAGSVADAGISFGADPALVAKYPEVVLAEKSAAADAWDGFVRSDAGKDVLGSFGFGGP
jgi:molybdate transport system substrate-binding protein